MNINIRNAKPEAVKKLKLLAVQYGLTIGQMFSKLVEKAK